MTVCACGCGRELPKIALDYGDPYATSVCAKRAHGVTFQTPHEQRGGGTGRPPKYVSLAIRGTRGDARRTD